MHDAVSLMYRIHAWTAFNTISSLNWKTTDSTPLNQELKRDPKDSVTGSNKVRAQPQCKDRAPMHRVLHVIFFFKILIPRSTRFASTQVFKKERLKPS